MSPFAVGAVGAATTDVEAWRGHLSAAGRGHIPSRAHRCARSHRISFGVQARPSSAGRQSQVRRDARLCLLCSRGGKHKRNEGSWPTLSPPPAAHGGRCPTPCLSVALPQPGKVSSEPVWPFPMPAAATMPHAEGSGPAEPGAAAPIRAMWRRAPRHLTARPAGPARALHCPPRGHC